MRATNVLPHRPPKGQLSEDERLAIVDAFAEVHACHDDTIDDIWGLCQALHFVGEAIGGTEQNAIGALARAIESKTGATQAQLREIRSKLDPVARKCGAFADIPKCEPEAE